jgi:hypothetical protein
MFGLSRLSLLAACLLVTIPLLAALRPGGAPVPIAAHDPMSSWNEGAAKRSITDFVARVTNANSPHFVSVPERIAVFDNDGTLWCEQPVYFQLFFAMDRVRALAPEHPEWKDKEPFRSILAGDIKAAFASGEKGLMEIVAATHSGMSTTAFEQIVRDWIAAARHPIYKRPYTECIYQPMLELIAYLRANGFKTYIVSGGGIEFMRPWTEAVYGIPPEQVVGSSGKTRFEVRDGTPVLLKLPELGSLDDGPGKPENINLHIGRRPVMAFGNSDGDLEMLEWTAGGSGARLAMLVHHTDAAREFAYDRDSPMGRLDRALDAAARFGWTVVDMKADWATIFPPAAQPPGALPDFSGP